ncbi:glycoside hydrolase family 2 TIM barrel-domain containing protein [Gracilibacillus salinarum]|uniref:DUF4982 domain-containing protein n=1 Tax=Gracilibacillus salinarum TaxID=2932255 RepID=A0ABY4GH19_9BACI|nr:glycoside hydrolase family 2 TIM barrel-domain containing protein [Gracilibacillus salinarum]UOQ83505.1 DUF4982 domain-containing protein [Gracilibacillus salinarum]
MDIVRNIMDFDKNWLFHKGDTADAYQVSYDDANWRRLNVPHDWSVEGDIARDNESGQSGGFVPTGIGWYRKYFQTTDVNKKVYIYFDGVYQNSEVWCNGHYLAKHPYGFTPFYYDITPYVIDGQENVIAVRVDNSDQPNCRWYTGSGIYRHVTLMMCNLLHVDHCGTYVTTNITSAERADVNIETTVVNDHTSDQAFYLETVILDEHDRELVEDRQEVFLKEHAKSVIHQTLQVDDPQLWSPDSPKLYKAKSRIICEGQQVDEYDTTFGIREITLSNKNGMQVNGESIQLKGVNLHHDAGSVGAAVPDNLLRSRLETLKEVGCNAIRCSHNPPAIELLDMCDEMGFLVIDEVFDKWWSGSYGKIFENWWQKDLETMILRDRNHPSIFMWSVGNEVEDQGSKRTLETLEMLVEHTRELEPTRPITCAIRPPGEVDGITDLEEKLDVIISMVELMDVASLNYQEQWYEDIKNRKPDVIIIGSETYPFFRGDRDFFKGYKPINPWFDVEENDYVIGQFIWAGIDYLGESMRWPSKGWAACLIDTSGVRKPISYLQQSLWTNEPMVQIAVFDDAKREPSTKMHWNAPKMASHWTFPHYENELIRFVTFTNCEKVEIYMNDQLKGYHYLSEFPDKMMVWYMPYEAGKIKAVGYNHGTKVCEQELCTAGAPEKLELVPLRAEITADGKDISIVDVQITDENGVLVPNADRTISFEMEGQGSIIGVDNGDLDSPEPYKAKKRATFHGRCRVIVQSTEQEGTVLLTAKSQGLGKGIAEIRTVHQDLYVYNGV